MLRSVIRRVRVHLEQGSRHLVEPASIPFLYLLGSGFTGGDVHREDVQDAYASLDDTDILF